MSLHIVKYTLITIQKLDIKNSIKSSKRRNME